jgi:hypothetical protein
VTPARQARERGGDRGLVQRHPRANFWSERISRGGFSVLPTAVQETSAT